MNMQISHDKAINLVKAMAGGIVALCGGIWVASAAWSDTMQKVEQAARDAQAAIGVSTAAELKMRGIHTQAADTQKALEAHVREQNVLNEQLGIRLKRMEDGQDIIIRALGRTPPTRGVEVE